MVLVEVFVCFWYTIHRRTLQGGAISTRTSISTRITHEPQSNTVLGNLFNLYPPPPPPNRKWGKTTSHASTWYADAAHIFGAHAYKQPFKLFPKNVGRAARSNWRMRSGFPPFSGEIQQVSQDCVWLRFV